MELSPMYYVFLLYVIPIGLLDCWFAFYIQKNYIGFLIVTILVIPCSILHIIGSVVGVTGEAIGSLAPQNVWLGLSILLGVGGLVLGVWGIIYRAKAMPQPQAAEG